LLLCGYRELEGLTCIVPIVVRKLGHI